MDFVDNSVRKPDKWKKFFIISAAINLIFGISIIASHFEDEGENSAVIGENSDVETKAPEKKGADSKVAVKKGDSRKNSEERKGKVKIPAGKTLSVSLKIKDNFYSAFTRSSQIKKLSEKYDLKILPKLLSAHVSRPLVWKLDLRKDIRDNDELSFVFRIISDEEKSERADFPDDVEILAVNYFSRKFNKEINLAWFKPGGEKYGAFYYNDGTTVEPVLRNSPIKDYIQITSLLKDRSPKHDGVDFKAPIGTDIYSPVNGTVTRTNWSRKYNGNCIEIDVKGKSHTVKFLHLDKVLVKRGTKLKIGTPIAKSGNTGKSTAPHLHYQVNIGPRGKVIDPMKFHQTYHKTLKKTDLALFNKEITKFKTLLAKADEKRES